MSDAVAKSNSVTILKTKRIEITYTYKANALKHIAKKVHVLYKLMLFGAGVT